MNIIFFNTIALGDYLVHSKIIKDLKLKYKCHITAVWSKYNEKKILKHHIDEIIYYVVKKSDQLRRCDLQVIFSNIRNYYIKT